MGGLGRDLGALPAHASTASTPRSASASTASDLDADVEPFDATTCAIRTTPTADASCTLVNAWAELTTVLNEMSRSMGQPDFYPFVMSRPVLGKLHFIHIIVDRARTSSN